MTAVRECVKSARPTKESEGARLNTTTPPGEPVSSIFLTKPGYPQPPATASVEKRLAIAHQPRCEFARP